MYTSKFNTSWKWSRPFSTSVTHSYI